jgi:hypothetical protein
MSWLYYITVKLASSFQNRFLLKAVRFTICFFYVWYIFYTMHVMKFWDDSLIIISFILIFYELGREKYSSRNITLHDHP